MIRTYCTSLIFCSAIWSLPGSALASTFTVPVNCDALVHSNVPFVISYAEGANIRASQVFRNSGSEHISFPIDSNFHVNRLTWKQNFVISNSSSNGDVVDQTYSVPLDKDILFDTEIDLASSIKTGRLNADGTPISREPRVTHISRKFIAREDVVVGPCIISTAHIQDVSTSGAMESRTDGWFSQELRVTVQSHTEMKYADGTWHVSSNMLPMDISTDFQQAIFLVKKDGNP